ncbi:MAG: site-2 protease family protein [Pseudonocardia sp.]
MRSHRSQVRPSPVFLVLVAITAGGGVLCTLSSDLAVTAGVVLLVLGGWAVSLCLHEFGHAVTAYRGGDTSVVDKGYLTLDIRRYTDPVLSFVLPLFFLLAGGIPLPGGAVWIQQWAIRSRAARSLISLAGPLVNLVLAVALTVLAAGVSMPLGLLAGLSYLALVQVIAFVLNMLPVPGLDGFGALEPYLSERSRELAAKVRPWAPLALFLVIVSVPGASAVLFGAGSALFAAVGGDATAASLGYTEFMFWRR